MKYINLYPQWGNTLRCYEDFDFNEDDFDFEEEDSPIANITSREQLNVIENLPNDFFYFLVDQSALIPFIERFVQYADWRTNWGIPSDPKVFFKKHKEHPNDYINDAFIWDDWGDTNNWDNLDNEWIKYLKSKGYDV